MKKLLTFLTLLTLSIGVSWAGTETVDFSVQGYSNQQTITSYTGTNFTVTFSKGDGNNAPAYYTSGTAIRCYGGNQFAVSSKSSENITSIVITFGTSDGSNTITTIAGSYSSGTWTGDSKSVIFSIGGTSGNRRIKALTVTTGSGGSTGPSAPTGTISFSPAAGAVTSGTSVEILCTGDYDGIKYTTDGITSPSANNGDEYDPLDPPVINEATTIKAAAYNKSNNQYAFGAEATASYTVTIPSVDYDGTATFNATEDVGTSPLTKGPVSFACSNGVLNNESEYRLYKNSTTTFSVPAGSGYKIVKIEFTGVSGNPVSGFGTTAGLVIDGNNGTWTGNAESVSFIASGAQVRCTLINVYYTAPEAPADGYYLVGDFSGDEWPALYENKFEEQGNGIYVLNKVLPDMENSDYIHFKIAKYENGQRTVYGGKGDTNQGDYGIHGEHHTGISTGTDGLRAFSMPDCYNAIFTFNTDDMTFSVDKPQLFILGGFNSWTYPGVEMTPDTENGGWTTTKQLSDGIEFRFYDAWHVEIGGAGYWIFEHDLGKELNMYYNSMDIFKMVDAGKYTFTVNNDKTKLVITADSQSSTSDEFELVTASTTLSHGDDVIIANSGSAGNAKAMSTTQNNNNRGETAITITNDLKVTPGESVQILTLESTPITYGGETFDGWLFNTGNGYLYAASSSENYLRTGALNDDEVGDNAKAYIEIESAGDAFIQFYGSNTHDLLRYNNNNKIFSCYTSGNQNPVYLYKRASALNRVATPVISPVSTTNSTYVVKGGLLENVSITCETQGATIYYTTDGTDPRTSETRQVYSEPFELRSQGGNMTIMAYAERSDMANSHLESARYLFTSPDAPTFNPESGSSSTEDITIEITSPDGGDIYYILDPDEDNIPAGQNDVKDNGSEYKGAITISGVGEHIIYAIAELNGIKSNMVTATYTIAPVAPTFDPASGTESDAPINVAINNSNEGGVIYYLVNPEEVPTAEVVKAGANVYESAITISGVREHTVYAVVELNGVLSELAIATYVINEPAVTVTPPAFYSWDGEISVEADLAEDESLYIFNEDYYEDAIIYYMIDPASAPTKEQLKANGTEFDYDSDGIFFTAGQHHVYAICEYNGALSEVASITINVYEPGDWKLVDVDTYFYSDVFEYIVVTADHTKVLGTYENGNFNAIDCEGNVTFDTNYGSATINNNDIKLFSIETKSFTDDYGHQYKERFLKDNQNIYYNFANSIVNTGETPIDAWYNYSGSNVILRDLSGTISLGYNDDTFGIYENGAPIIMYYRPKNLTLAELIANTNGPLGGSEFTIQDELVAVECIEVEYPNGSAVYLWCKDQGNISIEKTTNPDPEHIEDYMKANNFFTGDWDQSNWVAVEFRNADVDEIRSYVGSHIKAGTLKGTCSFSRQGHELFSRVNTLELEENAYTEYTPNLYCAANFLTVNHNGNATGHGNYTNKKYFFVNPKIDEICEITFAVWTVEYGWGYFTLPAATATANTTDIYGAFNVDWEFNKYGDVSDYLYNNPGKVYRFKAIVREPQHVVKSPKDGETVTPQSGVQPDGNYIVYPYDFQPEESIITSIETVNFTAGNGYVKSVKYVNVAGIVSDTPFQGVNIVVTEYTDGSRTTTKMLKR